MRKWRCLSHQAGGGIPSGGSWENSSGRTNQNSMWETPTRALLNLPIEISKQLHEHKAIRHKLLCKAWGLNKTKNFSQVHPTHMLQLLSDRFAVSLSFYTPSMQLEKDKFWRLISLNYVTVCADPRFNPWCHNHIAYMVEYFSGFCILE